MTLLIAALGLFYAVTGGLVLWRAHREWTYRRRDDSLTLPLELDRLRIPFMAGSALLFAAAGFALLSLSRSAVALLGAGLLLQAVYYGSLRFRIGPESGDADRKQAWTGAIISAAAFAFAAYAMRVGVLV